MASGSRTDASFLVARVPDPKLRSALERFLASQPSDDLDALVRQVGLRLASAPTLPYRPAELSGLAQVLASERPSTNAELNEILEEHAPSSSWLRRLLGTDSATFAAWLTVLLAIVQLLVTLNADETSRRPEIQPMIKHVDTAFIVDMTCVALELEDVHELANDNP